jgi:2-keto-3-deoxy-L-rhamnonate aldolase RhmA
VTTSYSGLRARLHGYGPQLLGLFVIIPRIEVVEAAATAGFDLVVIDCEHGPFGIDTLVPLVAAAQGAGIFVVVRVATNDAQVIGAVLDVGADGVLVPHVGSGEDALRVATASRYPPVGARSINLWVRATGFGHRTDYLSTADAAVAVLAMVEGAEAHRRLDEITAADDIDGVFVGPMDLAASMGLSATPSDPQVTAAARDIVARAEFAGKAASVFAASTEAAKGWLDAGVRLVVLSVDAYLMRQGFVAAAAAARPSHAIPPADPAGATPTARTENHA